MTFRRNVSEVKVFNKGCTKEGTRPSNGVFNLEGKLFIINYHVSCWFDEDVKAYHKDIMEARKANPPMNKRGQNRDKRRHAINKEKRKIKKLKGRIAKLEQNFSDFSN